MSRKALALPFFLAVTLAAASAVADEPEGAAAPAGPAPLPTKALHLDAYGGYSSFSNSGGGVLVGADVLGRWRFLQAGLLAEFNSISGTGSGNASETVGSYAAAGGLGLYGRNVALDALVVFGVHDYQHVGYAIGTNGVSEAAPFAGLRLGVSFVRLRPFTVGLWGYVNDDLTRTTDTYSFQDRTPGAPPTVLSANIGEWSYGGGLRIGADLDL
jgi:hypothetical protein